MRYARLLGPLALAIIIFTGCSDDAPVTDVGKVDRDPILHQITSNEIFEANPIHSPDGQWILFEAEIDGNRDLWRMPAAGGAAERLTHDPGFDSCPGWSPDGTQIVFESDRSGLKHIWVMDLAAPSPVLRALTTGSDSDASPAWSPDGKAIVFESTRDKIGADLWLVNPVNGELRRLTTTPDGAYMRTAGWSPGSDQVVCEGTPEGSSALFQVSTADGSLLQITPDYGYEGHPAWSPDGTQIAFESTRSGYMEVWVVPAGGGDLLQVTVSGGFWPQWTPAGDFLVFGVYGSSQPDIWLVEVDW